LNFADDLSVYWNKNEKIKLIVLYRVQEDSFVAVVHVLP
jgi:hypothetical protein